MRNVYTYIKKYVRRGRSSRNKECAKTQNVLDCFEMSLTCPGKNCRWANPNSHWAFWVVWNLSLKKTSSLKHFFYLEVWVVSYLALETSGKKAGKKSKNICAKRLQISEAQLRLIPRSQVRDKAVTKFTFCIMIHFFVFESFFNCLQWKLKDNECFLDPTIFVEFSLAISSSRHVSHMFPRFQGKLLFLTFITGWKYIVLHKKTTGHVWDTYFV